MQQRTCCICRAKAPKGELVRMVVSDLALRWDENHRLPGRGAYVHRRVECLSKMNQPAKWKRALRVEKVRVDFDSLPLIAKALMEGLE